MPTTGAVASITAGAAGPGGGASPGAGAGATIAAAATSHAVASLTLSTPYAISGAPSWVTAWSVGAKTASGFTLPFPAPCPAELRRLLHDENDNFWSAVDKTAYINAGMQRRDLDSGQNRVLISKTLTAGAAAFRLSP